MLQLHACTFSHCEGVEGCWLLWMMEGEHKGYRAGSELFVCFTSRQSMRLGPKCVLSPGRTEKLGESSSRRLRSSGSKGQSSPMFSALAYNLTGRKKNGSFETQEPTSPKVTCIGQVRAKSKHKKKGLSVNTSDVKFRAERSNSQRWSKEAPLKVPQRQECMGNRSNQKWGHLFGFKKEVSFSICEALRSFGAEFNCFVPCGGASTAHTPAKESKETTTCGAVLAKWFMVLQEDEKKAVEGIEETEQRIADEEVSCIREVNRLSVKKEDYEPIDETKLLYSEEEVVCPPRNALLLMKCRSVPSRIPRLGKDMRCKSAPLGMASIVIEEHGKRESEGEDNGSEEVEIEDEDGAQVCVMRMESEEEKSACSTPSNYEETIDADADIEAERQLMAENAIPYAISEETEEEIEESLHNLFSEGLEAETGLEKGTASGEAQISEREAEAGTQPDIVETLPNALLLMMCEPKLSLEISRETWVSKEDFVRRPVVVRQDDKEKEQSRRVSNAEDSGTKSMDRLVEESVKNPHGGASIVLTRCKSEPLRASVQLVPEACFWKPRNLEMPLLNIRGSLPIGANLGY